MTQGLLSVSARSDLEVVMTRVFDAPRRMVWAAWTKPALLRRWYGVRGGWSMAVCEVDLRVGGTYRIVWRRETDESLMGARGVYREVVPSERLVHTEKFDDPWYPGESVITTVLTEEAGRTTLTSTAQYVSREARDAVLRSPMERGVAESFDKLAELLRTDDEGMAGGSR